MHYSCSCVLLLLQVLSAGYCYCMRCAVVLLLLGYWLLVLLFSCGQNNNTCTPPLRLWIRESSAKHPRKIHAAGLNAQGTQRWIRDWALAYSMKCRIKSKCAYNALLIHYQSPQMPKTFFFDLKSSLTSQFHFCSALLRTHKIVPV